MLSFLQPRPYYSNIERLEGNLYLSEASTWAKLLPHAHAPRPPRATLELLSTDSPTPPRACSLRNFPGTVAAPRSRRRRLLHALHGGAREPQQGGAWPRHPQELRAEARCRFRRHHGLVYPGKSLIDFLLCVPLKRGRQPSTWKSLIDFLPLAPLKRGRQPSTWKSLIDFPLCVSLQRGRQPSTWESLIDFPPLKRGHQHL